MKLIYILTNPYAPDFGSRFLNIQRLIDKHLPLQLTHIRECVPDKDSAVRSINLSHKRIVREAMETKAEYVMVLEDDCWFPAKDGFDYFRKKWEDYGDCDIFLGGTYSQNIDRKTMTVRDPVGLHCYIMKRSFFETFLSIPDNKHIDTALEGLGKFGLCYPMAALQQPGYSANNKKAVDYNQLLKKEDVYGDFQTQ